MGHILPFEMNDFSFRAHRMTGLKFVKIVSLRQNNGSQGVTQWPAVWFALVFNLSLVIEKMVFVILNDLR